MEGEQTDFIWGVLDIGPITNFPDVRMRYAIHSAESGSVMIIPRENKLVRLYIQLTEVSSAGNLKNTQQFERVQTFGEQLAKPDSFIHRHTPPTKRIDSVIEIFVIHSAPRREVELFDLHEIFHPFDEKKGWDYNKVFVDDLSYHEGHGEAYENYGVDKERGCVVIARPDQYVGWIGELEDVWDTDRYFSEILLPQA